MPRKVATSADQQTLFGLDPIPTKEDQHEIRVVANKPKTKAKQPLSFHRPNGMVMCPVSTPDGVVWEELPETDERARHFIGLCRIDPKYLRGAEWRYEHFLIAQKAQFFTPPPIDYYTIWRNKLDNPDREVELYLF